MLKAIHAQEDRQAAVRKAEEVTEAGGHEAWESSPDRAEPQEQALGWQFDWHPNLREL